MYRILKDNIVCNTHAHMHTHTHTHTHTHICLNAVYNILIHVYFIVAWVTRNYPSYYIIIVIKCNMQLMLGF
jgi:hypothetical protein